MRQAIRYLLLVVVISVAGTACGESTTDILISVQNKKGKPIEGAEVRGMFYGPGTVKRDVTDESGVAELVAPYHVEVDVKIDKPGYYETSTKPYNSIGLIDKETVQETYILRKKRNPIPLYAKKVGTTIPVEERRLGFDFSDGDWVSPYGSGVHPDVYFEFEGEVSDYWNYSKSLILSFPGRHDGIQSLTYDVGELSQLSLPYSAPKGGYESKLVLKSSRKHDKGSGHEDDEVVRYINKNSAFGYFMRVESGGDGKGSVKGARYVKVRGDIKFGIDRDTGSPGYLSFTYYYNPKMGDRNLEYDVGNNRLKSLSFDEQVSEP